jgi:hypothetical protein
MPEWVSGPTVSGVASTADRSLTFSEDIIPVHGSAVRRMVVNLAGTNMTLANLTRVALKVKSQLRIDSPIAQFRAMLGYYGKKAEWASTATRMTVPLDFFMGLGADPSGKIRLELEKNGTPSGTITAALHQYIDEVAPALGFGYFLSSSQGQIGASAATQSATVNGVGKLVGMVVPDVANVTLLRIKQGSQTISEFTSSAAIIESAELMRGTTAVTEVYLPLPGYDIVPGSTMIQVSTNGSYTPGEWAFHSVQPMAA